MYHDSPAERAQGHLSNQCCRWGNLYLDHPRLPYLQGCQPLPWGKRQITIKQYSMKHGKMLCWMGGRLWMMRWKIHRRKQSKSTLTHCHKVHYNFSHLLWYSFIIYRYCKSNCWYNEVLSAFVWRNIGKPWNTSSVSRLRIEPGISQIWSRSINHSTMTDTSIHTL
jgi:hypothetical protein